MSNNLVLGKTATSNGYVSPYLPNRAIDGNCSSPTSRWLSSSLAISNAAWLMVDLGKSYRIDRWCVRHMPQAGWSSPDYVVSDYKLQGSNDNISWVDIDSVTNNALPFTDRTFAPVSFRFVRIYITKGLRINNKITSIMELEVYEAPASALLSNLTVSSGALSPSFAKNTFAYTTPDVSYSTSSITVTPTAEDSTAIIKINDQPAVSDQPTSVNLSTGTNTIAVQVTTFDGSSQYTYNLTIIRIRNLYLSNLALNSGTLIPAFACDTFDYIAQIAYDSSSITVTPTAQDATVSISVNNDILASGQPSSLINLGIGNNDITVLTTADNASLNYSIKATKASSPYLQSVSGIPNINFSKTVYTYSTATTAPKLKGVAMIAEDTEATITITANGANIPYSSSMSINLNSGDNKVIATIHSKIGEDNRIYTFTITRQ